MKEALIDLDLSFVANDKATEVSEPGECALDLPALAVASKRPAILRRGTNAPAPMGADQLDVAGVETLPQLITIVGAIRDQMPGGMRQQQFAQCFFQEGDFRRGRAGKVASQRNTLAVDHHNPLRSLASLGFSDASAPFFAGAKLASTKASLQSSRPRSLNSERKVRQMFSQISSSSHSWSRRQQVLALGYCSGRSRHRAPVFSTQRMPSRTKRFSAQGRPRLSSFGKSGSIRRHCSSVRNVCCIPSFSS